MIIGSSALKHWFPDFPREPKDVDVVTRRITFTEIEEGVRVEYLENPVLLDWIRDEEYCPPEGLLTLKASHLFWPILFEKHMFDVQWLLDKGYRINREWFYKLYDFWNQYHGKNKRSDLNMSAEDFFDNAVRCPYSHDELHTLINPVPTYTKVLIGEVEVSEEKFDLLSFEEKCALVQEELCVMAWERWRWDDYRKAYSRMLRKFLMSHAPLWEALFIIENYKLLCRPTFNYFKQIEDGLQTIEQAVS